MSGKPTGYASAGIQGARLAGRATGNTSLTGAAGIGGNLLGVYTGIQKGGVAGDTQAAVNAASLATKGAVASGAVSGATGAAVTGALADVAAPLAVYNAVTGWKQGSTLGNTLNSAEAGAAIGSVVPGVGTVVGAVVGGVVGLATSLIQGQHTEAEITNPNEPSSTTIKLQSGNSALLSNASTAAGTKPTAGVAFGAGSSNAQGSAEWFVVPATSTRLGNGPSVQQGVPFWVGTQATGMMTNFANSVPLSGGKPDFSSYIQQYQANPNAGTGLVGVYNNNGGQATWGMSYPDWLQSVWTAKNGVTGNLTST